MPNGGGKIPVVELTQASATDDANYVPIIGATGPGLTALGNRPFDSERLRAGDVFEVNVIDPGEAGLFASTSSKSLNLGRFAVDSRGYATMPFVGRQRVINGTTQSLQDQIAVGLKGSTVNPQVVVSVIEKPGDAVVVNGSVKSAGKIPLTARHERVLDAIGQAGGAAAEPESTLITIMRGGARANATLARVMHDPKQNIYLQPGDQILVDGSVTTITALGAFKSTGEIPFEPGNLSLAQAVGRAGGLLDDRADAGNIYVFRNQARPAETGPDVAALQDDGMRLRPVIYHANMSDAASIALMQRFAMRKGDVLYASNAPLVDTAKLFTVFQKGAPTAAAPIPPVGN